MSLSKFSDAMKNRVLLTASSTNSDPTLIAEIDAMEKAMRTSYDPNLKSLRNDAALVLLDKEKAATSKFAGSSIFRDTGTKSANTILVVTENNLKIQFDVLKLATPTIDGVKVVPGTQKVIDPLTKKIVRVGGLLDAYIVWVQNNKELRGSIEYYTDTSIASAGESGITGVRSFGRAHQTTSGHIYRFLQACGYRDKFSKYTSKFEIGHIESQAHGRLSITKQAEEASSYKNGLFDKLIELNKNLDIVSSSLLPQYTGITAAIFKDFTASRVYMNVEMQPKGTAKLKKKLGVYDVFTNQGSGSLSRAIGFSNIVAQMFTATTLDENGKKVPLIDQSTPVAKQIQRDNYIIAEKLAQLYNNFINNKASIALALSKLSNISPNYLIDLESSDSIRTFLRTHIVSILSDKKISPPKVKVKHTGVDILNSNTSKSDTLAAEIKQLSKNIAQGIQSLKQENKKSSTSKKTNVTGPAAQLRTLGGQFTSLVSLQNILNQSLASRIQQNMGKGDRRDILNYRSGRFAESAKVETMSQSREGMITAFYSYMRNPYATFSFGGAQSSPATRDPKLLISKSIREIGATMVGNRMRAVLV